jgi:hypothetical protein
MRLSDRVWKDSLLDHSARILLDLQIGEPETIGLDDGVPF